MTEAMDGENYRLLFVCTGNTCRSPLAEAIARRMLDARGWSHVEVASAGTSAAPGAPASEGSLAAAARHGLDLGGHRARVLTRDLAAWADLVLAMAPSHVVRAADLGAEGRCALLTSFARGDDEGASSDWGVPDPFGGDHAEYEATYAALEELVDRSLTRLEAIVAP